MSSAKRSSADAVKLEQIAMSMPKSVQIVKGLISRSSNEDQSATLIPYSKAFDRFFHSSQVVVGSTGKRFKIRFSPFTFSLAFSFHALLPKR